MESGAMPNASRDELLAIIAQQQTVIATLEARIQKLEVKLRELGDGLSRSMPGHKPSAPRREGPKVCRKRCH
jgi:hypothetical protein